MDTEILTLQKNNKNIQQCLSDIQSVGDEQKCGWMFAVWQQVGNKLFIRPSVHRLCPSCLLDRRPLLTWRPVRAVYPSRPPRPPNGYFRGTAVRLGARIQPIVRKAALQASADELHSTFCLREPVQGGKQVGEVRRHGLWGAAGWLPTGTRCATSQHRWEKGKSGQIEAPPTHWKKSQSLSSKGKSGLITTSLRENLYVMKLDCWWEESHHRLDRIGWNMPIHLSIQIASLIAADGKILCRVREALWVSTARFIMGTTTLAGDVSADSCVT